eukprot:6205406-Pleurochrysis_carterae.AAC.1
MNHEGTTAMDWIAQARQGKHAGALPALRTAGAAAASEFGESGVRQTGRLETSQESGEALLALLENNIISKKKFRFLLKSTSAQQPSKGLHVTCASVKKGLL